MSDTLRALAALGMAVGAGAAIESIVIWLNYDTERGQRKLAILAGVLFLGSVAVLASN